MQRPVVHLKPGHVRPVWAGHPWIYAQGVASDAAPARISQSLVRDRVRGYLVASRALFGDAAQAVPRMRRA